jgi:hypothetical protein
VSIFQTLRDAILGTTPQAVVAKRLQRIESVEADWQKIADTLRPLAIPPPFVNDTTGNPAFEAVRCIEGRTRQRNAAFDMAFDGFESAAKVAGANAGAAEFEARCRIKEVEW